MVCMCSDKQEIVLGILKETKKPLSLQNICAKIYLDATIKENYPNFKFDKIGGATKFFDEAKLISKFNGNPNIINVHEFFCT